MAASRVKGATFTGSYEVGIEMKLKKIKSSEWVVCKNDLKGRKVLLREQSGSFTSWNPKSQSNPSITAQSSIYIPQANRWWEKSMKSNMIEITSAQDLVDSLLSAGDKLVIVGFYSPGCGGCQALHPKICQLAETNPNALFLKVNYEEHKSMCHTLHIHVLPFFRFYRGAQGRVCSFSCTNATIYKLKKALENHGTDRCSLGPAKGLEESELRSLASNKEIQFSYPLRPLEDEDLALSDSGFSDSLVGEVCKLKKGE